jgi:lysophospholipase L1-like esterase
MKPFTMLPVLLLSLCGAFLVPVTVRAEPAVKTGEKIAFLGDSITQGGANNASGYVRLVISGLEANGIKATMIPAGISGHKSNQMLERLDKDVISRKPDWMTLSCGVNDVWHGANGVPLDAYKKNITAIVDRAQAAGIKVMILTATMIREDATNSENQKLAPYNDFLQTLAARVYEHNYWQEAIEIFGRPDSLARQHLDQALAVVVEALVEFYLEQLL